ncbi:diaminopimelate epimerase [Aminipila sp.]|uniref:diaminopimelate epimerase n=1 Tax=Aminipila sp. TaxID=2060095 RepID=UPI00289B43B8|nr:diaminopimelate epimerase [Aminipila sp.]
MKFTKMQGAGNDFIVINNMELNIPVEKLSDIAKKVCERRVSVGGDALMVVDRASRDGDFQMRFYNSDGTVGEMCGNGARCIARYAYENKIAGETMVIETLAGNVWAWRMDKRRYKIRLNNPERIELNNDICMDGKMYECSYIELGNPGLPHAVIKLQGLSSYENNEIFQLGSKIRHYKEFPKGANVNFYEVIQGNDVRVKTFERGVEDFTLACGTGSGSTAAILTLKGVVKKGETVNLHVPGGVLSVDVELNGEQVKNLYLIGDTNIVAVGEITDEDLVV